MVITYPEEELLGRYSSLETTRQYNRPHFILLVSVITPSRISKETKSERDGVVIIRDGIVLYTDRFEENERLSFIGE